MKIDILAFIGENCITIEDGNKLYTAIHSDLIKDHHIELNFTGVRIFASPFFNAAIGQLLSDINCEKLKNSLKISGLSEHGHHVLRRVIENSRMYYSNPRTKKVVDDIIMKQSNEA